jgi:hypothetical protein
MLIHNGRRRGSHEVALRQAAQIFRDARGRFEFRAEHRAADACDLHDAGLRRVFTSNSVETLLMLGLITLLFLALGSFVDTVRARALAWAGRSLDRKLAPAAIRSSLQDAASGAGKADTDALRDIAQLRTFLSKQRPHRHSGLRG